MIYRNKDTGSEIETDCIISGDNWEAVTPPAKQKPPAAKKGQATKDEQLRDDR